MAIALFCALHKQTRQLIQRLRLAGPALLVEQPGPLRRADSHSVLEVASRYPLALQRMAFPLASAQSRQLTRSARSMAQRQLTRRWHASCWRLSDIALERQNSALASKNVNCTPSNWAVHDTALRTTISRDVFVKLTPSSRLHVHVQSRVRLALAHVLAWRPSASTTSRIAQPNLVLPLGQSSH